MPRNDTIDTIKIGIQYVSTGKDTAKELDKISNALVKLQARVELVDLSKCIRQLNRLNKVDLSNITSQVNQLVDNLKQLKAFKQFTMNIKNSKQVNKILDDLTDAQDKWKDITISTSGGKGSYPLVPVSGVRDNYVPNFQFMPSMETRLEEMVDSSHKIEDEFEGIVNASDKFAKEMADANNKAKQLSKSLKNIKKDTKESSSGNGIFGSFGKSIVRIGLYRLIRGAIKTITQTIKEGIQSMAEYSSKFNDIMSEFKSWLTLVKNTLSSLIEPFMNVFSPILIKFMQFFIDQTNDLAQIFNAMAGEKTFTKAKYNAEDYLKSLNKIKNILVSFDEINKIGESTTLSAKDMYETVAIEQKYLSLSTSLGGIKSILDTIVNSGIINTLNSLFTSTNLIIFDNLGVVLTTLNGLLGPLIKVLNELLGPLNFVNELLSGNGGGLTGALHDLWNGNPIGTYAQQHNNGSGNAEAVNELYENIQQSQSSGGSGTFGQETWWDKVKNFFKNLGDIFSNGSTPIYNDIFAFKKRNSGSGSGTSGSIFNNITPLNQIATPLLPKDIVKPQDIVQSESSMVDTIAKAIDKSSSNGDIYIQLIDENGNVKNEQIVGSVNKKNRREGKQVIPVLVN